MPEVEQRMQPNGMARSYDAPSPTDCFDLYPLRGIAARQGWHHEGRWCRISRFDLLGTRAPITPVVLPDCGTPTSHSERTPVLRWQRGHEDGPSTSCPHRLDRWATPCRRRCNAGLETPAELPRRRNLCDKESAVTKFALVGLGANSQSDSGDGPRSTHAE